VQVDPFKPTLKAPGSERLKLKCDDLLSNFAFDFNLRRYIEVTYTRTVTRYYLMEVKACVWNFNVNMCTGSKVGRCSLDR